MARKKTNQEFISELKEKNIDYIPLEEYINATTKIKFRCSSGHVWEVTPHNILNGRGCPYCSHSIKLSNEDFITRLKEITNTIIPIEGYKSFHEKMRCLCVECGNEWMVTPAKLLNNRGCPICARKMRGKNRIANHENGFKIKLKNSKPNILLLEEYSGVDQPIKFKCNICGYEFCTTPYKVLKSKYGCKNCHNNSMKISNSDFKTRLSIILPDIIPIDDYVNFHTKIKYYCKNCGEFHYASPANLLHGYGCPTCNASKGEKQCKLVLEKMNIAYEPQYIFPDLFGINGGHLRFDFGILDNQLGLIGLIEYDGIFHYEKQYENDGFENIKKHDKLKDKYCISHDIPLLRIPYWDFDRIEELISTFIFNINNNQIERGA